MNPTGNPARFLDWKRVLRALRIKTYDERLFVQCPFCADGALRIWPDELLKTHWLYCRTCRWGGDLIELCCKRWGLPVEQALRKLKRLGVTVPDQILEPAAVAAYLRDHVHARERVDRFWDSAIRRRDEEYSESACELDEKLEIYASHRTETCLARTSRFLGNATVQQVEDLFHPSCYQRRDRVNKNGTRTERRGSGAGQQRIFKGEGWGEVLVLPYYDLPGRICGFLFIGRNADPSSGDIVYKAVNRGLSTRAIKNSGVAMLDAITGPPDRNLKYSVFLLKDPLKAIRLQVRSLLSFPRLLPLPVAAVWFDDHHQTQLSQPLLAGRQKIFWAAAPDDWLLRLCSRTGGNLYFRDPLETRGWMVDPPLWWLRYVRMHAVLWRTALQKALWYRPLDQVCQLLLHFRDDPNKLQRFLNEPWVRDKLQPRWDELALNRVAHTRGHTITESPQGWLSKTTGKIICNGNVRLEEVLHCRSGPRHYRGTVQFGEQDLPFLISVPDTLRHGLLAAIKQVVEQFEYEPGWSKRVESIAYTLHPRTARGDVDVVGYHDRRFWFPGFSLKLRGHVEPEGILLGVPPLPAATFVPPATLTKHEIALLSARGRETRIFWATAACIAFNVLAHMMRWKPRGIGLVGRGAQLVGQEAARLLGCVDVPVPNRRRPAWTVGELKTFCQRHNWPALAVPASGRWTPSQLGWLTRQDALDCVAPLYREEDAQLASANNWHLIRSERHFGTLGSLNRVGSKVLPHYLLSVCQRQGFIYDKHDSWLLNVLCDLAEWLHEAGGDREAVLRAVHLLSAPGLTGVIPRLPKRKASRASRRAG